MTGDSVWEDPTVASEGNDAAAVAVESAEPAPTASANSGTGCVDCAVLRATLAEYKQRLAVLSKRLNSREAEVSLELDVPVGPSPASSSHDPACSKAACQEALQHAHQDNERLREALVKLQSDARAATESATEVARAQATSEWRIRMDVVQSDLVAQYEAEAAEVRQRANEACRVALSSVSDRATSMLRECMQTAGGRLEAARGRYTELEERVFVLAEQLVHTSHALSSESAESALLRDQLKASQGTIGVAGCACARFEVLLSLLAPGVVAAVARPWNRVCYSCRSRACCRPQAGA